MQPICFYSGAPSLILNLTSHTYSLIDMPNQGQTARHAKPRADCFYLLACGLGTRLYPHSHPFSLHHSQALQLLHASRNKADIIIAISELIYLGCD